MMQSSQSVAGSSRAGGVATGVVGSSRSREARRGSLSSSSSGLRQVSWRWQGGGGSGALTAGVSKSRKNVSFSSSGVQCKVIDVTEKNFESEVLDSPLPVLVDFWASWCGPCKLVATSMDRIDRKYEGQLKVVKIETDPNPALVKKYEVYGLPTLILFREGEVVSGGRYEGAISLAKLESILKKALPTLVAV